MVSPNDRYPRERSFSPSGRNFRSISPAPSIASVASIKPGSGHTVVETLRPRKNHAGGAAAHRSRRVIGGDGFHLPPEHSPAPLLPAPAAPAATHGEEAVKLTCPICNVSMHNIGQLNRHLDDAHNEVGQREKDNVQSKFMKYLSKARSYPSQALNSTFAYADLSDLSFIGPGVSPEAIPTYNSSPNGSISNFYASASPPPPISRSPHGHSTNGHTHHKKTPSHQHPMPSKPKLTEDSVTRAHWQRETANDRCTEPHCRRLLNNKVGKVNCRSCGRLYCDDHVGCQMKLSKSAQWDPVEGVWCRVCFSCFESRPGYNDASGEVEDLTSAFRKHRQKRLDKAYLEVNLLEKRLARLLKLMIENGDVTYRGPGWTSSIAEKSGIKTVVTAASAADTAATLASSYLKQIKNYNKSLEQSVVNWEDDKLITECRDCNRKFNFTLRKHHCRLCGKVICSDPSTGCSTNLILDFEKITEILGESVDENISIQVRLCKDCKSVVYGRREFAKDTTFKPQYVKIYETMVEFRRGIEALLPRFQKLLDMFDDPSKPPSHELMQEATKVRKKLLFSFQEFDTAAKRIFKMPTKSPQQAKLQSNVHMAASQVLQMYMLPLRSLPSVLKHVQASSALPQITKLNLTESGASTRNAASSGSTTSES